MQTVCTKRRITSDRIIVLSSPCPNLFASAIEHILKMVSTDEKMAAYRSNFIKSAVEAGALKFGSFTLKSGR